MDNFQNNIKNAINEVDTDVTNLDTKVTNEVKKINNQLTEIYPNIYSTEEVRIGTDIDGKGIYRREFYMGEIKNTENSWFTAEISPDLDIILNLYGGYRFMNSRGFVPWNFYNAKEKKGCGIYYTGAQFNYFVDYSGYDGFVIVEYKKTTD